MLCARVCEALFSFLLSKYPSGVAGSCCNSVFDQLRNCQTISQSSCCIFHSHFQCIKFPLFPLPCQHLLSDFLIQAIILGVKWYLTVIFFFRIFWLHCTACGILVPWLGIELLPPAVEAQSLNHWTTTRVPLTEIFTGIYLITNDGYMLFNDYRIKWNNLLNVMHP